MPKPLAGPSMLPCRRLGARSGGTSSGASEAAARRTCLVAKPTLSLHASRGRARRRLWIVDALRAVRRLSALSGSPAFGAGLSPVQAAKGACALRRKAQVGRVAFSSKLLRCSGLIVRDGFAAHGRCWARTPWAGGGVGAGGGPGGDVDRRSEDAKLDWRGCPKRPRRGGVSPAGAARGMAISQWTGTVLSWRGGQRTETVPSPLRTRMLNSCSLRSQRDALRWLRLVVGGRVTVGGAVAEHREDALGQLVGGGDDGALVAAFLGQGLVIRLELAVNGARGAVGALDEHGAQRLVATAGAPGAAFGGALVVAGTQAGPGGEAVGVAEHARVGSDLAQDGAGRRVVDAGEGPRAGGTARRRAPEPRRGAGRSRARVG